MGIFGETSDLERLLARCKRQDTRAWSALVEQLQGLVYSIPRRYGLNEDDAADVFQTTFQALYRNLDRIESGQALPKWVSVTASREALRLKRIASRTVSADGMDVRLDEIVASEEASAEEEASRSVASMQVRQGIAQLQAKCRDLLTALYLDEEESYAEISEKLKMPVGAIGPTRSRCLDKLRRILVQDGFSA